MDPTVVQMLISLMVYVPIWMCVFVILGYMIWLFCEEDRKPEDWIRLVPKPGEQWWSDKHKRLNSEFDVAKEKRPD
jgi:hypothetical protein